MHGCICLGAVGVRPGVSWSVEPEPLVWVGLPGQSSGLGIGSASLMHAPDGTCVAPVCSGRNVRILLASLVI